MNNHAKVLFFATIREKTGVRETMIDFDGDATILDIKMILLAKYPSLKLSMDSVIVAMNHEYAFDEYLVVNDAEIALFPPVSGGSKIEEYPTIINISVDEIDINILLEKITLSTTGAASIFTGIVRGETIRKNPYQTDLLEYEAYKDMAEMKMLQIVNEMRTQWRDIEGIALVQRIGKLFPGMITVVIACTASHRDSGIFDAAKYGIDRLKEIVPIWKKEVNKEGDVWIEGDYYPLRGE